MPAHALAPHVPEFLRDLVLSPHEQAAEAANADERGPAAVAAADDASTAVEARRRDGSIYPGDFVGDVVRYRELRARSLCGELLDGDTLDALSRLEAGLRQPRDGAGDDATVLRSFYRFECDFPAEIVAGVSRTFFDIRDISAGGIKAVGEHRFTPGDTVNFVVVHRGGSLTFPSRVAWVKDDAFGLMFAGAARYADGGA